MEPFFVGDFEPNLKCPFICGSDSRVDNHFVNVFRSPVLAKGSPPAGPARRAGLTSMLTVMLPCALALPSAWAGDERDHERARSAVQMGEVLPLPTLLEKLQRTHPGKVLELELERDDGRWIYEVKLLQTNGQLLKLELDAGTGQLLQVKRKQDRSRDRKVETSKEASK